MRNVTGRLGRPLLNWAVPVAGAVSLAVPASLVVAWIFIFHRVDAGQEVRVTVFMSMLPGFVRGPVSLTFIALACSIAAVLLGAVCVRRNRGAFRAVGVAEIALGSALACLLLFSLM